MGSVWSLGLTTRWQADSRHCHYWWERVGHLVSQMCVTLSADHLLSVSRPGSGFPEACNKQTKRKSDQVVCLISKGLLTILRIKFISSGKTRPLVPPLTLSQPARPTPSEKGLWSLQEPCFLSLDGPMARRVGATPGLFVLLELAGGR